MLTALHPFLLWGLAAIAVPVLIHLLLRQRPQPRPWAAMRWLLAAAQASQRRYRLTNLLLLLLRCLIVLLVVLAVARPSIAGFGGAERLVLVVDATASMGPRGSEPGPLAEIKAALAATPPEVSSAALVVVTDRATVLADGPLDQVLDALSRVDASAVPGGIDRVAALDQTAAIAQVLSGNADVLLMSDFQQDDGNQAAALCQSRCRSVTRWCVGKPTANAVIAGIDQVGDAPPGQPGELAIHVAGAVHGAAVAVDDGPFLATAFSPLAAGAALRLVTPPLAAGSHRVRVRIDDDGLLYDNLMELPVQVRPAVPALVVQEKLDYLGAALAANTQQLTCRTIRPAAAGTEPLPTGGVVALRAVTVDSTRIAAWVRAGGVLWARWSLLHDDLLLSPLISGLVVRDELVAGGEFLCGDADLDEVLRSARCDQVPRVDMPANSAVLLRAGQAPLVVACPAGNGAVIVEWDGLADNGPLVARGTTPTWVARTVRRVTARLHAPETWVAGAPAPRAVTLTNRGRSVPILSGAPLVLAPGLWEVSGAESRAVIVLPSREEGRIDRPAPTGTVTTPAAALPRRPGRDWGLFLALAALAMVVSEGLVAAWAAQRYGR